MPDFGLLVMAAPLEQTATLGLGNAQEGIEMPLDTILGS